MTQSDDLYPLDGGAFVPEPAEQVEERNKEKGETLAALPMLESIIGRFAEKIAFYDSVDSIPEAIKLQPETFVRVVEANKLTRNNLIAEKEWLEGLIDEYTT